MSDCLEQIISKLEGTMPCGIVDDVKGQSPPPSPELSAPSHEVPPKELCPPLWNVSHFLSYSYSDDEYTKRTSYKIKHRREYTKRTSHKKKHRRPQYAFYYCTCRCDLLWAELNNLHHTGSSQPFLLDSVGEDPTGERHGSLGKLFQGGGDTPLGKGTVSCFKQGGSKRRFIPITYYSESPSSVRVSLKGTRPISVPPDDLYCNEVI